MFIRDRTKNTPTFCCMFVYTVINAHIQGITDLVPSYLKKLMSRKKFFFLYVKKYFLCNISTYFLKFCYQKFPEVIYV